MPVINTTNGDLKKMSNEKLSPESVQPQEKLAQVDFLSLELVKTHRKIALANAEKALAQNESTEMAYRYVLLQICYKYGLNLDVDKLSETGEITRGSSDAKNK